MLNKAVIQKKFPIGDWQYEKLRQKCGGDLKEMVKVLNRMSNGLIEKGYVMRFHTGSNAIRITREESLGYYESDDEAIAVAIAEGNKIIPETKEFRDLLKAYDLPSNGWLDIAENKIALSMHLDKIYKNRSPCSLCEFKGKALGYPPCDECPARPKFPLPNCNF